MMCPAHHVPTMPWQCIICGKNVPVGFVNVYLTPPEESKKEETDRGYPFVLSISPCCGARACVEAAWEHARVSSISESEFIDEEERTSERFGHEEGIEAVEPTPEEQAFLARDDGELAKDFVAWAEKAGKDPHDVRDLFVTFLTEALSIPRRQADRLAVNARFLDFDDIGNASGRKAHSVYEKVGALIDAKELKVAEQLVPECVEWARKQGLRSLLHSDVDVFLGEKSVRLSFQSRRSLWAKAKLRLRARS